MIMSNGFTASGRPVHEMICPAAGGAVSLLVCVLTCAALTSCSDGGDLDLFDEIDRAVTQLAEEEGISHDFQNAARKSAELREEMAAMLKDRRGMSTSAGADVLTWDDLSPVFEKHCFRCHGTVTPAFEGYEDLRQQAQKRVDMRVFPFEGHPSGQIYEAILDAIVVGDNGETAMPIDARRALSTLEIRRIRRWILEGANGYVDPDVQLQVQQEADCLTWPSHCRTK